MGYPGPMTCILDRTGSIRHVTEVFSSIGKYYRKKASTNHLYLYLNYSGRSVDETLRTLQALKLVDESGGSTLPPGDWRVGDPYIRNTRPGVDAFYAARAGLKSNMFSKIGRMVISFFKQGQEEEKRSNFQPEIKAKEVEVTDPESPVSETPTREVSTEIKSEKKTASSGDEVKFIDIY